MELNYSPVKTFAKVHQDFNRFLFIRGPVGSGKTSGLVWQCLLNSLLQPPDSEGIRRSRYAILRSTYPVLKSTTIKTFQKWFKHLLNVVYDVPIRGEMVIPHPDGETSMLIDFVFIALDREEEINKLQSLELTGACLNEAAEIPEGIFQMLKTRINRWPLEPGIQPVKPFILCEYNAPATGHWLYTLAEDTQPVPPKHSFYVQPPALIKVKEKTKLVDKEGNYYKLNPQADNIENLTEEYYEDMVLGNDADFINVMILNNYGMIRTGRPVYADYQDAIHCVKNPIEPIEGLPLIIGMDFGLQPAAAICQLTLEGTFTIIDEITTEDCSIEKFCDDYLWSLLWSKYRNFNFYLVVDPAGTARSQNDAKSAVDILREKKLPWRIARTNDPSARKNAVVKFLRKLDGFRLSPNCSMARKGFISEYKFEKRSAQSELFKEKPEKNQYSHIHDAIQYAALEMLTLDLSGKKTSKIKRQRYTIMDTVAGY